MVHGEAKATTSIPMQVFDFACMDIDCQFGQRTSSLLAVRRSKRAGAQPLPGAVTLEIFGLGIDPVNERFIPVDAFTLASGTGSNPHRSNCVNPDKDTEQPLESGGEHTGLRPSTAKLQRIMGTLPGYRMLTPYEIELLRKSKREIDKVAGEVFAAKKDAS